MSEAEKTNPKGFNVGNVYATVRVKFEEDAEDYIFKTLVAIAENEFEESGAELRMNKDDFKEALQNYTEDVPYIVSSDKWVCPKCHYAYEIGIDKHNYCPNCGKKINREYLKGYER